MFQAESHQGLLKRWHSGLPGTWHERLSTGTDWPSGKVSVLGVTETESNPIFMGGGGGGGGVGVGGECSRLSHTMDLHIGTLICQAPGMRGSALGLVGPVVRNPC